MISKIKKRFRESLFLKSLKLIIKKPQNLLYFILFDLLFILAVYALSKIFSYVPVPKSFSIALLYSLLNFTIFVFVYSFFKYAVLDYIVSFMKKTEFSFKRLKDFFMLNVLLFLVFSIVMVLVNMILVFSVKQEYMQIFLSVVSIIVFIFIYTLMNISHSFFVLGSTWKESFFRANSVVFKKMKKYLPVYGFSILVLIIIMLIGNLVFVLLKPLMQSKVLNFYQVYMTVYYIVTMLFMYALHIVNRLYFYLITGKVK